MWTGGSLFGVPGCFLTGNTLAGRPFQRRSCPAPGRPPGRKLCGVPSLPSGLHGVSAVHTAFHSPLSLRSQQGPRHRRRHRGPRGAVEQEGETTNWAGLGTWALCPGSSLPGVWPCTRASGSSPAGEVTPKVVNYHSHLHSSNSTDSDFVGLRRGVEICAFKKLLAITVIPPKRRGRGRKQIYKNVSLESSQYKVEAGSGTVTKKT